MPQADQNAKPTPGELIRVAGRQVAWRASRPTKSSRTRRTAAKESSARGIGGAPARQKPHLLDCQPARRARPVIPPPSASPFGASPAGKPTGSATSSAQPDGPIAAPSAATRSTQLSSSPASSPCLLAELADGQVQDVGSFRHHERLHEQVERVAVLVAKRLQQPVRDGARGLPKASAVGAAEARRPRSSSAAGPRSKRARSIQALRFSGVSARVDIQRRNPARSARCTASSTPAFSSSAAQARVAAERFGDRSRRGERCLAFGIGVVGQEDDIEVGCHIPREIGRLVDAFDLANGQFGHGSVLIGGDASPLARGGSGLDPAPPRCGTKTVSRRGCQAAARRGSFQFGRMKWHV